MDQPSGIVAEADGGSVFLHNYQGQADTLSFDSFIFNDYHQSQSYLVRLDSNGKVLNAVPVSYFGQMQFLGDGKGNYFLAGITSGNDSILKFDKNFNRLWATKFSNIGLLGGRPSFSDGHLYFSGITNDSNKIVEVNTSNGNVIWGRNLCKNKYKSALQIGTVVHLKGKLYMSGRITGVEGFQVGPDTFYSYSGFVMQTDSLGNYERRFLLQCKSDNTGGGIFNIATDGNFLYICGNYKDTVYWGNKKITPQYPASADHTELFAASLTSSLTPRWFFRPKVLDKTDIVKFGNYLVSVVCSKGMLYFSGEYVSKILIDSNILTSPTNVFSIIVLKADSLGNILWATSSGNGGGRAYCMDAKAGQSVQVAGVFTDSIKLGKHSEYNNTKEFDVFVTKLTDYSITRGKVSSGPYCAGDTIKIPYTKFGVFDSTNVFVAQLSDENGNFDKSIELGRFKSNKDGTIIGKLPMFQVVTSKLYRIRILSTNPKIQSYYRTDTLRLLIFSKDKANPGKDETICKGDTVKLSTYGGSKWTWSPKYRMSDSAKRQPLVWPLKDTIYKIIISDSSGCGKPDTAFKRIFVRPYPTSKLQFKDTAVCDNSMLKIPVKFVGGDSVYQWQWYFVNPDKSLFKFKSGKLKLMDTLNYYPSVTSSTSEKLAIILKDGCTAKADTAFLTISLRKKIEIKPLRDTTLCIGNIVNYKAQATGGVAKQYHYQWQDITNNTVISTNDSLKIKAQKTFKIELSINDGCKALGDSKEFTIIVKPPLKALTNLRDTIICEAKTLNYNAQAIGGNSKAYKFYWVLNGKQIDTTNSLTLTSALTSTLTLITKDNCSLNDTVKKTITVNPSPKADFSWDLECNRTVTKFQFTGTKPNNPITTSFHWNFNNEASSSIENPSKLFSTIGAKTLTLALTSSNGCTDTIKKTIEIKPQSKADFTATDVCETDSAVFINKSQDATGYNWKFGDGQTSKLQNPRHKFQISSTTTYNVTLVAQVTKGCADSISKAVTINKNPSSDFSYTYNGSKVDLKITKAGNSYQWKFGTTDSAKTSATTYSHTIKSSDQTKVCLTATDISGCSSQTCKNVSVRILKVLEKSFKIYPNPNNGSFTIEIENPSKEVSIEFFNLLGERVARVERVGKVNSLDLGVAEGIYLVRVKNGDSTWNQRVSISFGGDTNR